MSSCETVKNPIVSTSTFANPFTEKTYQISSKQQKDNYSVGEFKQLYSEYLKLNNREQISTEENKQGMSNEDKIKFYSIYEVTPEEVKNEIGCQIFKVNYTYETFVVYKSKMFHIGVADHRPGVLSMETCDFDADGQKDLIYTFSWGSGMNHSEIGIYNFSKEQELWLDSWKMNYGSTILKKISDSHFKVYCVKVSFNGYDFIHPKLSKKEYIAEIKNISGKIGIMKYVN
jgi:hypothetical protein